MDKELIHASVHNKLFVNMLPVLMRQASPDIDMLEAYVTSLGKTCEGTDVGLAIKYSALKKSPTAMEATMTKAQLYGAGNTLWATSYSPQLILSVLLADKKLKQYGYQNYLETLFHVADEETTSTPSAVRLIKRTRRALVKE